MNKQSSQVGNAVDSSYEVIRIFYSLYVYYLSLD